MRQVVEFMYSFDHTNQIDQKPPLLIISNIGYYASEKDLEGIKEEVHRYVLYRTQK